MSASTGEIQPIVDELLTLLGLRICVGQLVIHLKDYRVNAVETNTHHAVKKPLDGDKDLRAR